jgi:TonB family protein
VRRDGTVSDVKVLRRLGAGLDDRAIEAVRQWRFAPATRHGTPVDVIVEVAVEFNLR